MNKSEIQKLLHHRDPYLLIDEVLKINELELTAVKILIGDEYFFKGHFPNAPILPGAMMQEMTTQTAGVLITKFYSPISDYDSNSTKGHALGVLKKVNYAKYKGFAKPGDLLRIEVKLISHLESLFHFKANIYLKEKVIMSNSFCLVNIKDSYIL
jgi:3-hydroxyacyl-[acyl-carrier-protein] dehydratase